MKIEKLLSLNTILYMIIIIISIIVFQNCSAISIPPADRGLLTEKGPESKYKNAVIESRKIVFPLLENYPGISVAVSVNDTIVWSETFGFADIENNILTKTNTQFRVYSLAKPITATAIMILKQQGKINLDDKIKKYLKDIPNHIGDITIKQLVGHLSGIRDYRNEEWLEISNYKCSSTQDALNIFVNDPLENKPGSQFNYSSFNYVLLSALIETVSKMSFSDFIKENIFFPAQMTSSFYENDENSGSHLSKFYKEAWFGDVQLARKVDNSCKFGAGGLISTAQDLVLFGSSLITGSLVDQKSLNTIFTPLSKSDGEQTNYSFGWFVGKDSGLSYAVHSGGAIGGRSALVLLPESKIVVAVAANIEHKRLIDQAFEIAKNFRMP